MPIRWHKFVVWTSTKFLEDNLYFLHITTLYLMTAYAVIFFMFFYEQKLVKKRKKFIFVAVFFTTVAILAVFFYNTANWRSLKECGEDNQSE